MNMEEVTMEDVIMDEVTFDDVTMGEITMDEVTLNQVRQIQYLSTYLSALDIVKWGIPKKISQNAVQTH